MFVKELLSRNFILDASISFKFFQVTVSVLNFLAHQKMHSIVVALHLDLTHLTTVKSRCARDWTTIDVKSLGWYIVHSPRSLGGDAKKTSGSVDSLRLCASDLVRLRGRSVRHSAHMAHTECHAFVSFVSLRKTSLNLATFSRPRHEVVGRGVQRYSKSNGLCCQMRRGTRQGGV